MPIATGTRFDRYQIISPIGSGGMGEIYLAQDTRLNRKVAIKLLPDRYTQDPERLRRFEKEAQAASALNHPNIITIFEIGEADGRHFIATEYIEGSTLRKRMVGARLTINETLDIASQVVSALAAAHAAGIVHRDIKPENIMIRPDGYVKVLDFGLAKLTEKPQAAGSTETSQLPVEEPETPTTADLSLEDTNPPDDSPASYDLFATVPPSPANETIPGVVMGTAQYMSPEQARGLRVDSRTDIFSFGIMLYEMIARRAPFSGSTSRDIIRSILHTDPPPLSHFQPEVPEVLEWVVAKALIKDREERYQTAKEMLNDLRRLHRRLGVEQEIEKSRSFASGDVDVSDDKSRDTSSGASTKEFELRTGLITGARSTGDLTSALAEKKTWITALFTLLIAIIGFAAYRLITSEHQVERPFQQPNVKRFTTSGKATRAALSPDGNYVVHVLNDAGKQSLLVRQVTESNNIEIVPPAEVTYRGMTFSRDGAHVFYVVQEQTDPIQMLYQVPALGGVPRRILKDIDSPVAISPDNKQLAFVRRYRGQNEDVVIVANIDGSDERKLASRKGADFFGTSGPSWSPDGKIIACPAGTNTGGRRMYVAEVSVADGKEKPISDQSWASVGRVSWMRDQTRGGARAESVSNHGLIFSAAEKGSSLAQIWYLPYPKGEPRKITNDLSDYRDLSVADDSRALVTVQVQNHVNIWLSPNASGVNMGQGRQITNGIGENNGVGGLTWLSGGPEAGRVVYVSRASTSQDIWLMDQDGKNKKQLTTAETRADRYPAVSPDGRYIVFVSNRTNNSNIYRYDLSTGEQKQLTTGMSEEFPAVSADGKWVIYVDTRSIKHTLWKVPIDGGDPVQLTDQLSTWPDISPDGQMIACWYRSEPKAKWRIAIIPISGGAPEKVLDVPPIADFSIPARWMPDGSGISFVATRDGVSNIWYQPLDGGAPKQLTSFTSDQIFWFDWSNDGKQLACSRGRTLNDVVLISESKQ
ncbi:MAG: protein kinase [Blastocatellales bacterium]